MSDCPIIFDIHQAIVAKHIILIYIQQKIVPVQFIFRCFQFIAI